MRLINVETSTMEEYLDNDIPPYAILSHTWGSSEVDFCEWQRGQPANKDGYAKIIAAQNQAQKDGLKYLWVDTCCIDKRSSAELSEAINSMFAWYRDSSVCYAFLADVQIQQLKQGCRDSESVCPASIRLEDLKGSRWFTRGWTLQELLSPRQIRFFSGSWICLGTKESLAGMISEITLIHIAYLTGEDIRTASIAQRMSWASGRITKRQEDIAYCLMGIFDVNMPLLYGEKGKAFIRLQEEILKKSNDESTFAWGQQGRNHESNQRYGLLATSPKHFSASATIIAFPEKGRQLKTTNTTVLLRRFIDLSSDPSPNTSLYVRLQVRDLKRMTSYICLPVDYVPGLATYCRVSTDYPAYVSPGSIPFALPRLLQTKSWYNLLRDIDNTVSVSKEQPIMPKRLSRPAFDIVVEHSYLADVNDELTLHKNPPGFILPSGFTGTNAIFDPRRLGIRRNDISVGFEASMLLSIAGRDFRLLLSATTIGNPHYLHLDQVCLIDDDNDPLCELKLSSGQVTLGVGPRPLGYTTVVLNDLAITINAVRGASAEIDCAYLVSLHAENHREESASLLKLMLVGLLLWMVLQYLLDKGITTLQREFPWQWEAEVWEMIALIWRSGLTMKNGSASWDAERFGLLWMIKTDPAYVQSDSEWISGIVNFCLLEMEFE